MHAGRVQRSTNMNALRNTVALHSLQGYFAFLVNAMMLLVGGLQCDTGRQEIVKLALLTKHMNRTAWIDNARSKRHFVRDARTEKMRFLILQADGAIERFATERLVLDVGRW
jgi:hypothetical protein